ncbi:MAG TPA: STAS domain-containing protein [Saprospiraceae bacterium]|nr:STAS domain-containing protein [Saprospiraceae bacterium]MCC6688796.1 STAS domain-containing protein [Saprospiraceae bacterium]HMV24448.1 STAS domain-containing protein [Saprospiraceae bacterium]HMX84115.1 STAS domain-containing protein [Saprospiraceae bacterium]HMX85530.1 STAS domain-containing protein [Saprospiraceae bacterium]
MKFEVEKEEKYTIFRLNENNLNSIIAPMLKSEFVMLNSEGVKNLIFDMSEIHFVDSSGLSAILTANRLWKDNGLFVMTGITHPNVIKLIDISRLNSVLTIIPTVEESVEYVFMDEIEKELYSESDD